MIKNYFLIAVRILFKHKAFSIINISGLAMSISICLMIIIYIKDQKSSDQFHEKKERIARVYTTDRNIQYSEIKGWATTPGSVAPYLLDNYSTIEDAVRLRSMWADVLHSGTAISIRGFYAEPSFFDIFSYPLLAGDPETALNEPYSIVISEETAQKFFGEGEPIHKTLTIEKLGYFTVTGILKKLNRKSHFRFDALVSFATLRSLEDSGVIETEMHSWSSFKRFYTYVLLKTKDDRTKLNEQLPEIAEAIFLETEHERFGFKLQPLLEINLGINLANSTPGTKHRFDIVFVPFVAMLIIFLACFNYIMLSIARSLKRTREIGLRKTIGATRGQIIKLFLTETFVITSLSLITACYLILWLIPAFNGLDIIQSSQQQLNIELMKDPGLYIIFILFAIGVSIVAGLYPALYLSSFQPANALRGASKIAGFSRLLTRKFLMGIQFAVSLMSIIFIVYFYRLHIYWMTFDPGIAMENFVDVYLQEVNHEIFRNEIISNSNVAGVSFSDDIPIYGGGKALSLKTEKMDKPRPASYYSIDPEFIHNFQIELIAGRNFSKAFSTDIATAVIINEKAVQAFELISPEESIGRTLASEDDAKVTVIGVVKDFNYTFPDVPIDPLVLRYRPEEFRIANIRYLPGKKDEIKAYLPYAWKKYDKVHPVHYKFLDEAQEELDTSVRDPLIISVWAGGFVVLITLFGLLGMVTYTTEVRVKEIGIRKVLGASVSSITYLLTKDYIRLISYAAIFAIPAGFFLTEAMMQDFAFRPNMSLWVLPAALIFILVLALLTVGSQTVKAALTNPVETLKEE